MPAFDFNLNRTGLALHAPAVSAAPAAAAAAPAKAGSGFSLDGLFEDVLDIINPLQHLPVVGTVYRYLTHDTMDTVSKIAGDALYGGLWGAIGAVADTAFEAVTGKDFGATVLALVTGDDDGKAPANMASAAPGNMAKAAVLPQPPAEAPAGADVLALADSLSAKGVDSALSARALYAYRRSQGLTASLLPVN